MTMVLNILAAFGGVSFVANCVYGVVLWRKRNSPNERALALTQHNHDEHNGEHLCMFCDERWPQ